MLGSEDFGPFPLLRDDDRKPTVDGRRTGNGEKKRS